MIKINLAEQQISNQLGYTGGGFNYEGEVEISNCTVSENEALYAGGGSIAGLAYINDTVFMDNYAQRNAGGLYLISESGQSIIRETDFINNVAKINGGGLYSENQVKIANCNFSGNFGAVGGGVFTGESGESRIENCVFDNNAAMTVGSGIASFGNLHIIDCKFINNSGCGVIGILGGTTLIEHSKITVDENMENENCSGIYIEVDGKGELTDVIIENQQGIQGGGGICCNGEITARDCQIVNNSAEVEGGGIEIGSSGVGCFSGMTISNNSAELLGGGIFNCGTISVIDSEVTGNSALYGGGIYNYNSGRMEVSNCSITENNGAGIYNLGEMRVTDSVIGGNLDPSGTVLYNNSESESTEMILANCDIYGRNGSSSKATVINEFGTMYFEKCNFAKNESYLPGYSGEELGQTNSYIYISNGNNMIFDSCNFYGNIFINQSYDLMQFTGETLFNGKNIRLSLYNGTSVDFRGATLNCKNIAAIQYLSGLYSSDDFNFYTDEDTVFNISSSISCLLYNTVWYGKINFSVGGNLIFNNKINDDCVDLSQSNITMNIVVNSLDVGATNIIIAGNFILAEDQIFTINHLEVKADTGFLLNGEKFFLGYGKSSKYGRTLELKKSEVKIKSGIITTVEDEIDFSDNYLSFREALQYYDFSTLYFYKENLGGDRVSYSDSLIVDRYMNFVGDKNEKIYLSMGEIIIHGGLFKISNLEVDVNISFDYRNVQTCNLSITSSTINGQLVLGEYDSHKKINISTLKLKLLDSEISFIIAGGNIINGTDVTINSCSFEFNAIVANEILWGGSRVMEESHCEISEIDMTISGGQYVGIMAGGFVGCNGGSLEVNEAKLNITRGTFANMVGAGIQCCNGGTGKMVSGKVNVEGGKYQGVIFGGGYSQGGNIEVAKTEIFINEGNINNNIYGGNYAYADDETDYSELCIVTEESNIVINACGWMYGGGEIRIGDGVVVSAGSFGQGRNLGNTNIIISGKDNYLILNESILFTGDNVEVDLDMPKYVDGTRSLVFDGYTGNFNAKLGYFDRVEIKNWSSVFWTADQDCESVTGGISALADVKYWDFEIDKIQNTRSALYWKNGINDFTDDEISITFNEKGDALTMVMWVGNGSMLTGWRDFSEVRLNGVVAEWSDEYQGWLSGEYYLTDYHAVLEDCLVIRHI